MKIGALFVRTRMQVSFALFLLLCTVMLSSVMPAVADGTPAAEPPLATVNGKAINTAEVDAYAEMYQIPPNYALRDFIDSILLKAAATELKVAMPAEPWSSEIHDKIEITVAQGIGIDEAKPRIDLLLDHAWIKDADDATERAAARTALEKMRSLVVKGMTIPTAFAKLQLDGSLWHIGDHEMYPYEAIPPEARDLRSGAVSPVLPGDGGQHLFMIYEKKEQLAPIEVISSHLRDELRRRATIEQRD